MTPPLTDEDLAELEQEIREVERDLARARYATPKSEGHDEQIAAYERRCESALARLRKLREEGP